MSARAPRSLTTASRARRQVLHRFKAQDNAARQAWLDALGRLIEQTDAKKGLVVSPAPLAPGASGYPSGGTNAQPTKP